jgi:hypothetical protein
MTNTYPAFLGLRVVSNPLCVTRRVWYAVERSGAPWRRRKRWRVKRHEKAEPCAYQLADGTVVMHPTIYEQFRCEMPFTGARPPWKQPQSC